MAEHQIRDSDGSGSNSPHEKAGTHELEQIRTVEHVRTNDPYYEKDGLRTYGAYFSPTS